MHGEAKTDRATQQTHRQTNRQTDKQRQRRTSERSLAHQGSGGGLTTGNQTQERCLTRVAPPHVYLPRVNVNPTLQFSRVNPKPRVALNPKPNTWEMFDTCRPSPRVSSTCKRETGHTQTHDKNNATNDHTRMSTQRSDSLDARLFPFVVLAVAPAVTMDEATSLAWYTYSAWVNPPTLSLWPAPNKCVLVCLWWIHRSCEGYLPQVEGMLLRAFDDRSRVRG